MGQSASKRKKTVKTGKQLAFGETIPVKIYGVIRL